MASTELKVEVREEKGRNRVKRLRAAGKIPAVIYGHGGESVSLSLPSDEFNRIISHGDRIVSLSGGASGDAFIREVQWDTFATNILHVDFTRVTAGEMIETTVAIELRGHAPGTHMGGTVEQPLHELVIECPPRSMTDRIEVSINELQMDQKITVGDLALPEGSETEVDPDTVVAQCVEKKVVEIEEEVPAATSAEPEVIGEKKDDEGGED